MDQAVQTVHIRSMNMWMMNTNASFVAHHPMGAVAQIVLHVSTATAMEAISVSGAGRHQPVAAAPIAPLENTKNRNIN